jgi:uncharacterized membrane protein YfcA
MLGAGVLSALIGIGSGTVKVIAMDRLMRLPFKVSTTTSGSWLGARLLPRIKTRVLRMVFAAVVAVAGVQLIYKGLAGRM